MTGDKTMNGTPVSELLADLLQRLRQAFGDALVSVILYGSAATGDWNENQSDLNILCVLQAVTPHELQQSEPVFRWWRAQGNGAPLLLSEEEVRTSSDSFPMEFHDLQEHRQVLYGSDVIEGLAIDLSFYRAHVEHELRAKHIRLRQKAADLLSHPERLQRLLTDSVSTFCVLGRHALILGGHTARAKKSEIVEALGDVLRRHMAGMEQVLALSSAPPTRKPEGDVPALFASYLRDVDALVRFVDGLGH